MAARPFVKLLLFVGVPVAAITALVAFWNWDWLIPIVEGRASSALGRQVKIAHLHVRLGQVTTVGADDVRILNPAGFPLEGDFARIARLSVQADVMAYLRSRQIVLPEIAFERPDVQALQTADGKNNYTLALGSASPAVRIGDLRVSDGQAHVVIPTLRADFGLRIGDAGDARLGPRHGDAGFADRGRRCGHLCRPTRHRPACRRARFFRWKMPGTRIRLTSSLPTVRRMYTWRVR